MSAPATAAPRTDSLSDALYRAYWRTMGVADADIDRALQMPDLEGHWDAVAAEALAWIASQSGRMEHGR